MEDKTGVPNGDRFRSQKKIPLILLLGVSAYVGCSNKAIPAPKNSIQEGAATISLFAITNSNQSQTFNEVRQASLLPKGVLEQFGGLADPGQPFNNTDDIDPKLPQRQLIVAAVSKQYCIISYWEGGFALTFKTTIFELSGGSARVIWVSISQGGLNFRDLKEMVESGRMHNDLSSASW